LVRFIQVSQKHPSVAFGMKYAPPAWAGLVVGAFTARPALGGDFAASLAGPLALSSSLASRSLRR